MSSHTFLSATVDWRRILLNDFWLKWFGTSAFMALFFWAYLYLLKAPAFAVTTIALTAVDDWIGFAPLALIPYLSLWFYCALPVVLMPTRLRLLGFGAWIGLMSLLALAIFYFWPSTVPPAHIDWTQYPGVAFLKGVDAAGNACPSMHVAASVYTCIWLYRLLGELRLGWRVQSWQMLWGLAIVYSTMATKQHVALDVLAGTLLGLGFAVLSLRWDNRFVDARGDAVQITSNQKGKDANESERERSHQSGIRGAGEGDAVGGRRFR